MRMPCEAVAGLQDEAMIERIHKKGQNGEINSKDCMDIHGVRKPTFLLNYLLKDHLLKYCPMHIGDMRATLYYLSDIDGGNQKKGLQRHMPRAGLGTTRNVAKDQGVELLERKPDDTGPSSVIQM